MTIAICAIALAQVAREAQAVLAGHVDVDQRQVDRVLGRQRARRVGALGAERGVAVRDEVLLEHLAHVRLVVDDQDGGLGIHGRLFPSHEAEATTQHPIGRGSGDDSVPQANKTPLPVSAAAECG